MKRYSGVLPAGLAASLAAVLAAGCLTRSGVQQEIDRQRIARYRAWERAARGEGGTFLDLKGPLSPKGRGPWRRKKERRADTRIVLRGKLDLASAVLIAVGNNKQLGAVLEDRNKARGRLTEAYAAAYPKLDLNSSYRRLDRVSTFTVGGVTVATGARNNYSVSAVLTQPIFRGGAIAAGIRAAKLFALLTDEQVAASVQDVVFQARQGYLDVLLARELVKVSKGNLELAKEHLKDVRKKKKAGVVSEYDVLRARVEVSNVEAELIERQNAHHLALTQFFKTLGVSQESRVELTDTLEHAAERMKQGMVKPDLKAAVREAFRRRPEILQAELNVRMNREAVAEARAGFFPSLDASFTHSRSRPDPHDSTQDRWGHEWNFALTLTWPLFDGLATWGRVRQAKAELARSVLELADAEEQVLLDVKQALFGIQDAEKFFLSQEANLERAREALRLARAGYEAGVKTEIEMRDARQALTETQARFYQAVHRYESAVLSLRKATGSLRDAQAALRPR